MSDALEEHGSRLRAVDGVGALTAARLRHWCVVRSCDAMGRGDDVWSDRRGEFVERGSDAELIMSCVNAEFVVASADVLYERVAADDDARGAVGLEARIGRSRAFNRPWSQPIRLFAYCSVSCTASGISEMTFANAAARSVTTTSGRPCASRAPAKNRCAAAMSRRFGTNTSMTWPCSSTAR